MVAITVRGLDDDIRSRLRVRAARNGRSMEAEVRDILKTAVGGAPARSNPLMDIYWAARDAGGVELDLPERRLEPSAVDFSGPEFG